MKTLFALPLLLLSACQPTADKAATECAVPFEKTKLLVGDQVRHYVLVPHFQRQRKACWGQLHGYLQSADAPLGTETGTHLFVYLDTTDFALPAGGALGGAARGRVIAQQLYQQAAGLNEFTVDPNGTGHYRQPH